MNVPRSTEHLTFRQFHIDDLCEYHCVMNDESVVKFTGDHLSLDMAEHRLQREIEEYKNTEHGTVAICLCESNKIIGYARVQEYEDGMEIIIGIIQEHQSKGYGTELFENIVKWAKSNQERSKIYGRVSPDNEKSTKLVKKCGMRFIKEIDSILDGKSLLFVI